MCTFIHKDRVISKYEIFQVDSAELDSIIQSTSVYNILVFIYAQFLELVTDLST
jgi:hypothetical protein